jgi:peptidoglycan/LPS O-acetylase OafA/YrhL
MGTGHQVQFRLPEPVSIIDTGLKQNTSANPVLRWTPALDGLRAIAIAAVMARHFKSESLLPGGALGVDLFFVLSGFLITTLLMQEWLAKGTIRLARFYQRRALRLLPALFAFLLVYLVVMLGLRDLGFTGADTPRAELTTATAAVLYCVNWLRALGGVTATGSSHLWSLSVEEQYYLLWPGLLLLLLRLRASPFVLLGVSGAVVLWSASLPLWADLGDRRLYFGTDFRVQELMAGSLASQLFVFGLLTRERVSHASFRLLLGASVVFLAALLFVYQAPAALLFEGAYLLVAGASAVVVVACVLGGDGAAMRVLGSRPMVYVGRRSYALYLWHFPISYWLRDVDAVPQIVLATLLSLLAAELSYRLVEAPALRRKQRLAVSAGVTQEEPGAAMAPVFAPESSASTAA